MECNIQNIIDLVNRRDKAEFKNKIKDAKTPKVTNLVNEKLSKDDLRTAISWFRDENQYLIHNLMKTVERTEDLEFILNDKGYYKSNFLCDGEEKTWLHVAVVTDRSYEILEYLVKKIELKVQDKDSNKYMAIHLACLRDTPLTEQVYRLLVSDDNKLLITESADGVTPLELACADIEKLKTINNVEGKNLRDLLSHIDKLSVSDEAKCFPTSLGDFWIKVLHNYDKHKLNQEMKYSSAFNDKYYLRSEDIDDVLEKSNENGQGILTHIKNLCKEKDFTTKYEKLFTELSGLKVCEKEGTERLFYKSALFVALITGRLDLVPQILSFCQFNIILYGLLTCLICDKLLKVKDFPEQVLENIDKIKQECENYSAAVLHRTAIKDLTEDKRVIISFLIERDLSTNQRMLDIAHLGRCTKFLSLPSCQQALTHLWYKKDRYCPAAKFYLHSIFHILFLLLFSYILMSELFPKVSIPEYICYAYGLGYLIEEIRQCYCYCRVGLFDYYLKDPNSYLDIFAIVVLIGGAILRILNIIPYYLESDLRHRVAETKDINLFFMRLILCCSYIMFFVRVIYFGFIFEQLGPKFKMISKMIVKDLLPVIFIFLIFIVSFGISFESLLFSNGFRILKTNETFERKSRLETITDLIKRATFTIFNSQYCLEEIENPDGEYHINDQGKLAVYFLLLIYIVIVNIMLMNLLIAIFSNTVTEIVQTSRESWEADRYKNIKEYLYKSLLPPPFNIIEIIIEIPIQMIKCCKKKLKSSDNDPQDKYLTQFMAFKILQAFSVKNCRYALIQTEEDKEYERKVVIQRIKKDLKSMEKSLRNLEKSINFK